MSGLVMDSMQAGSNLENRLCVRHNRHCLHHLLACVPATRERRVGGRQEKGEGPAAGDHASLPAFLAQVRGAVLLPGAEPPLCLCIYMISAKLQTAHKAPCRDE